MWREGERREALRLVYDVKVGDAALELYQGQLTLLGRNVGHLYGHYHFKASKLRRGSAPMKDNLKDLSMLAGAVPERPEALYYLALLHRLLGLEEEAREEAAMALERDPGFVPAAILEVELRNGAYVLRDWEIEDLRERYAPGEHGDWQEPWLLAYRCARDRDWEGAAREYQSLIDRRAKKPDPYIGYPIAVFMGHGVLSLEMGEFQDAILDFDRASTLWPRFPETRMLLGKAHYKAGDPAAAERVLQILWEGRDEGPGEGRKGLGTHIQRAFPVAQRAGPSHGGGEGGPDRPRAPSEYPRLRATGPGAVETGVPPEGAGGRRGVDLSTSRSDGDPCCAEPDTRGRGEARGGPSRSAGSSCARSGGHRGARGASRLLEPPQRPGPATRAGSAAEGP